MTDNFKRNVTNLIKDFKLENYKIISDAVSYYQERIDELGLLDQTKKENQDDEFVKKRSQLNSLIDNSKFVILDEIKVFGQLNFSEEKRKQLKKELLLLLESDNKVSQEGTLPTGEYICKNSVTLDSSFQEVDILLGNSSLISHDEKEKESWAINLKKNEVLSEQGLKPEPDSSDMKQVDISTILPDESPLSLSKDIMGRFNIPSEKPAPLFFMRRKRFVVAQEISRLKDEVKKAVMDGEDSSDDFEDMPNFEFDTFKLLLSTFENDMKSSSKTFSGVYVSSEQLRSRGLFGRLFHKKTNALIKWHKKSLWLNRFFLLNTRIKALTEMTERFNRWIVSENGVAFPKTKEIIAFRDTLVRIKVEIHEDLDDLVIKAGELKGKRKNDKTLIELTTEFYRWVSTLNHTKLSLRTRKEEIQTIEMAKPFLSAKTQNLKTEDMEVTQSERDRALSNISKNRPIGPGNLGFIVIQNFKNTAQLKIERKNEHALMRKNWKKRVNRIEEQQVFQNDDFEYLEETIEYFSAMNLIEEVKQIASKLESLDISLMSDQDINSLNKLQDQIEPFFEEWQEAFVAHVNMRRERLTKKEQQFLGSIKKLPQNKADYFQEVYDEMKSQGITEFAETKSAIGCPPLKKKTKEDIIKKIEGVARRYKRFEQADAMLIDLNSQHEDGVNLCKIAISSLIEEHHEGDPDMQAVLFKEWDLLDDEKISICSFANTQ